LKPAEENCSTPMSSTTPTIHNVSTQEIVIPVVCFGVLALYFIISILLHHFKPNFTSFGTISEGRREWIWTVMLSDNMDLTGVQTLRNGLMASSFLAGIVASLLFISLGYAKSETSEFARLKLLILCVPFLFSFFNFALNMRYLMHLSFLVSIRSAKGVAFDEMRKYLNADLLDEDELIEMKEIDVEKAKSKRHMYKKKHSDDELEMIEPQREIPRAIKPFKNRRTVIKEAPANQPDPLRFASFASFASIR
jgi:hypothetical protein